MSDFCGCDDAEYPSVYEARDVAQARKEHECTECARAILPGESYLHIWGVWPTIDNHPNTLRICARCMALKEWVEAHIPCACLALGALIEYAQEAIEYNDEDGVLKPEFAALVAEITAQPSLKEFAQNSNVEKP